MLTEAQCRAKLKTLWNEFEKYYGMREMDLADKVLDKIRALEDVLEIPHRPFMIEADEVDFSELRRMAKECMEEIEEEKSLDDDWQQWIFEQVMECFYGTNVWDHVNSLVK